MIDPQLPERLCRRFGIATAAVAVVKGADNWVWTGPAGAAAPATEAPFYLASCSKAYTATAIALAVGEGLLEFDQPAVTLVPELNIPGEGAANASLRDLLAMRTGLRTAGAVHFGFRPDMPVEERLRRAAFAEADKPFGQRFGYHNIGPIAARVALERASGMPIGSYLRSRLLTRLGMRSTWALGEPGAQCFVSPALPTEAGPMEVPLVIGANSLGAGGLFGSIADAVAWMRFQIDPGAVLDLPSSAALAQTQSPQSAHAGGDADAPAFGSPMVAYGMGWFVGEALGSRLLFHGGNVPGCGLMVLLVPEQKLGIACYLAGPVPFARYIALAALEAVTGGALITPDFEAEMAMWTDQVPHSPKVPERAMSLHVRQMTGRYMSSEAGELVVEAQGRGLVARYALCPLYDGKIGFTGDNRAQVAFDAPALRPQAEPEDAATLTFAPDGSGVHNGWLGRFDRILTQDGDTA
jgi:CubicO group peptidase (beta-lactamase class C family)